MNTFIGCFFIGVLVYSLVVFILGMIKRHKEKKRVKKENEDRKKENEEQSSNQSTDSKD